MKKVISIFLALAFVCTLCSCGSQVNKKDWKFLKQYDERGKISCDRAWAIKTESAWDQDPEQYLAYFGPNGKLIYGWKVCDWLRPHDFQNGYALVVEWKTGAFFVIDKDGNELFADSKTAYAMGDGPHLAKADWVDHKYNLTNFNEKGRAYFIGKVLDKKTGEESKKGYYVVDKTGIYRFQFDFTLLDEGLVHDTSEIGDMIFVNDRFSYSVLFDAKGKALIDFVGSFDFVPKTIELEENDTVRAHFIGKDDKPYVCVVDYNGNFVQKPTPDDSAN